MLQTVSRIKPFSLGKIYGLFCATATLLIGLLVNAYTVLFGQRALTLTWPSITFDGQMLVNTLMIRPIEILLLTCIITVIVLVLGFIYGAILALIYNFSAGIGGGLEVELQNSVMQESSVKKSENVVAAETPVSTKRKASAKKATKKK